MDNENESEEIIIQHGVTLKKASANYISALNTIGVLVFGKYHKGNVHFFEWKMSETCEIMDTDSQDSDWSLVQTTASPNKTSDDSASLENDPQKSSKPTIRVLFRDLKGIEFSKTEFRLYNHNKTIHSLYLFNHGSPHSFVDFLERKRFVKRSSRQKHFYHCLEETDCDKLQKSFSELNIEDITSRPRPTNVYMDFMSKLASMPHQILPLSKQPDVTISTRVSPPHAASGGPMCNGAEDADGSTTIEHVDEAECRKLAPRPAVHRGEPLNAKQWAEFRATDGSITDADRVKDIIFHGGISNDIRAEVWKYLLGLDIWEHTSADREERRTSKTSEYYDMKLQWETITPVQEQNFTGYRERKCQIEKDVKRTDRTYEFFAGDDNPNLATLQQILMTYVMYNFDLGYVQGMSDLLAPILCLVQHQADSFWCFVGFMQKSHQQL